MQKLTLSHLRSLPEGIVGFLVGLRIGLPNNESSVLLGVVLGLVGAASGGLVAGGLLAAMRRPAAPWRLIVINSAVFLSVGPVVGAVLAVWMTAIFYYWLVFSMAGLIVASAIVLSAVVSNCVIIVVGLFASNRNINI